jgi:hypothetical protein
MTLGRTTDNKIKIKTDEEGGGLRAVECACCGGGNLPDVCLNGSYPNNGWGGDENGYSTSFLNIVGCDSSAPPGIANPFWITFLCGGAKWALLLTGTCLGNGGATNYYCKSDGIDSPIGTYRGYNYGGDGYLTFTVTEKLGGSC